MTDADEAVLAQAMSRALRIVADEPGVGVPAPGLAERVVRAHRGRRALLVTGSATVVVAVLAVTAVVVGGGHGTDRSGGVSGPRPTSTGVSADLRAAVRDARFVRTVAFDDGALTVEPADSGPLVTEPDALNLFRTTGGGGSTVIRDVVVGYGTATLRPGLDAGVYGLVRHTPVWVVVSSGGARFCAFVSGQPSKVPEGRHVFLLDRNGTWAVDYRERGSSCGQPPTGPTATVARQYSSIAWTAVARAGKQLTVRYQSWGCAPLETAQVEGGSAGQRVQLTASGPFMTMSCPAPIPQTTQVQLASATAPVSHAPTGPIRSYTTDGSGGLRVYDGR